MQQRTLRAACIIGLLLLGRHGWAATEAQRIERLQMLADLWGKLYLFHPRIVTTGVDWNHVLIDTIPRVENAANTDELVAILNDSLFRPLDDPFLVAQKHESSAPDPPRRELAARKLSAIVGYLDATDPRQYGADPIAHVSDVVRGLGPVQALIVDLRFPAPLSARLDWLRLFLDAPQTTGAYVRREHYGWNEYNSPNAYRQGWKVNPGSSLAPLDQSRSLQIPTAFIVNQSSYYGQAVDVLDCLQTTGRAVVMLERRGRFASGSVFFHGSYDESERYAEDIEVRLPTSELLSRGNLGAQPDHASSDSIGESELAGLAGKLLEERKSHKLPPSHPFSFGIRFPSPEPVSQDPISREKRILGLFKIWTVIRYLDLDSENASVDWSEALRDWIGRVEQPTTLPEYFNVLRRFTAQLNDSHVAIGLVSSPPARNVLPIQLRPIEGRPVVVRTLKDATGNDPPVRIGDEVLAVNGKTVEELFAERRPQISASTPGALLRNLVYSLFDGQGKDTLEVTLKTESGPHTVNLKTIPPQWIPGTGGHPPLDSAPSYRVLDGGFGYINLDTLSDKETQPALRAIMDTKGLVLDMRGYPRTFIQHTLIPGLTDKPMHTATSEVPVVSNPDRNRTEIEAGFRWIEPDSVSHYTNPIAVLIDDRAQSAAEDFCIYLRNAKRAIFVGSTTAGADGNVTFIDLPAGRRLSFTGMRMKFADGSRFQNIGIVPDVKVEPTIRGIRAGRDEVLEKGLEVLRSHL